jgi:ribose transport system permease protein
MNPNLTEEKALYLQSERQAAMRRRIVSKLTLPAVLLLLWILLSITTDTFFTTTNFANLLRQASIYGVVATGVTFCIISGNMDLSVGSMMGLSSMILSVMSSKGVPIIWCLLFTLVIASVVGFINGMMVMKGGVPAFIGTLGMSGVLRGIVYLLCGGKIISNIPKIIKTFSGRNIFGIPIFVFISAFVVILGYIVSEKTKFGRYVFAVGSNKEVAKLSGIKVVPVATEVYILSSCIAAVAGWMLTARLAGGQPTAGAGFDLECVTAVVIGGATLGGGEGSVFGTVVGVLTIITIRNGGNLLNVNSFWLEIVTGLLTVGAVLLDQMRRRRSQQISKIKAHHDHDHNPHYHHHHHR